jgi:hypothetical protein
MEIYSMDAVAMALPHSMQISHLKTGEAKILSLNPPWATAGLA